MADKNRKYFGNWSSYEEMEKDWSGSTGDTFPNDKEVLFASYDTPPYEGRALVLFRRDRKLYEVSDSHCSCNGLEWGTPGEVTWESLSMRPQADGWDNTKWILEQQPTEAQAAFAALVAKHLKKLRA